MLRILVFNGTPQAAESRLVEAGSRTYDTLIREAFDRHLAVRAKIDYFTLRVADDKRLPQGLGIVDFDGVWISGSPFNAYRPDQPSVQTQIDLVREIWEKGVPAFGSCWGLQLMTVALGGTVQRNPRGREVGVARRIYQTSEGRAYAMHHDKAPTFEALCVHEDEVAALPSFGTVLASNDVSRVQAAVMTEGVRGYAPRRRQDWAATIRNLRESATCPTRAGRAAAPEIPDPCAAATRTTRCSIQRCRESGRRFRVCAKARRTSRRGRRNPRRTRCSPRPLGSPRHRAECIGYG
jgi:GMP synthase-like glutamine amidotransferase